MYCQLAGAGRDDHVFAAGSQIAPSLVSVKFPFNYSPPVITTRPSARTAEAKASGTYPEGRFAILAQLPSTWLPVLSGGKFVPVELGVALIEDRAVGEQKANPVAVRRLVFG